MAGTVREQSPEVNLSASPNTDSFSFAALWLLTYWGIVHNSCPSGHFFEGGGGLEIFKKRSDISILIPFSSGHFRSSGGRKKSKCPTDINCE